MSYTVPPGSAADVSWVGLPAYTAPPGDGANATWAEAGPVATGAGTLGFSGAGAAWFGVEPVVGTGAGALGFAGSAAARHGVRGLGAGALSFVGVGAAVHQRYEIRGTVKKALVVVDRRVRCYSRATGELIGQADTVAGKYRVPAGFTADEVYTLAIDLATGANDWIPPTANRLVPVLADDTL